MKLRLPHKFQAALMAALASVSITTLSTGTSAYGVTTNTTTYEGTVFNGDIWTWNNAGDGTSVSNGSSKYTNYETSQEYAGNADVTGVGKFWQLIQYSSEQNYVGNTLRFSGYTGNIRLNTDYSAWVWVGGIITEAGNTGTYTLGRDSSDIRLKGSNDVNFIIGSNFTLKSGKDRSTEIMTGGTWDVADGKLLTFEGKSLTFDEGQTVKITGAGTVVFNTAFTGQRGSKFEVGSGSTLTFANATTTIGGTITNAGTVTFASNNVTLTSDLSGFDYEAAFEDYEESEGKGFAGSKKYTVINNTGSGSCELTQVTYNSQNYTLEGGKFTLPGDTDYTTYYIQADNATMDLVRAAAYAQAEGGVALGTVEVGGANATITVGSNQSLNTLNILGGKGATVSGSGTLTLANLSLGSGSTLATAGTVTMNVASYDTSKTLNLGAGTTFNYTRESDQTLTSGQSLNTTGAGKFTYGHILQLQDGSMSLGSNSNISEVYTRGTGTINLTGGTHEWTKLGMGQNQASNYTLNVQSGATLHITGTLSSDTQPNRNRGSFLLSHWGGSNTVNVSGKLISEAVISSWDGTPTITVKSGGELELHQGLTRNYSASGDTRDDASHKITLTVEEGGTLTVGATPSGDNFSHAGLEVTMQSGTTLGGYFGAATDVTVYQNITGPQSGTLTFRVDGPGNTLTMQGTLSGAGSLVKTGSGALMLNSGYTLNQAIALQGGSIGFAGNWEIGGITHTGTTQYTGGKVEGTNGFASLVTSLQLVNMGTGTSIGSTSGAHFTIDGVTATLDATAGTVSTSGDVDYTIFHVMTGSENVSQGRVGGTYDPVYSLANGTELVVDADLTGDKLSREGGSTGNATLNIQADKTYTSDGNVKHVTITGAGTYELKSGTTAMVDSLAQGEDGWTGTVRISNASGFNNIDIDRFGHAGSAVELNDVSGFFKSATGDGVVFNSKLVFGAGGYIWTSNGYSNSTYEFKGGIGGSGTFTYRWKAQTFKVTGDVTDWNGIFLMDSDNDVTFKFSDNATVVNAEFQRPKGTLNVEVGNGTNAFTTTFNEAVGASTLTIKNNASATLKETLTLSGSLTLDGSATLEKGGSIGGSIDLSHGGNAHGTLTLAAGQNLTYGGSFWGANNNKLLLGAGATVQKASGAPVTIEGLAVAEGEESYVSSSSNEQLLLDKSAFTLHNVKATINTDSDNVQLRFDNSKFVTSHTVTLKNLQSVFSGMDIQGGTTTVGASVASDTTVTLGAVALSNSGTLALAEHVIGAVNGMNVTASGTVTGGTLVMKDVITMGADATLTLTGTTVDVSALSSGEAHPEYVEGQHGGSGFSSLTDMVKLVNFSTGGTVNAGGATFIMGSNTGELIQEGDYRGYVSFDNASYNAYYVNVAGQTESLDYAIRTAASHEETVLEAVYLNAGTLNADVATKVASLHINETADLATDNVSLTGTAANFGAVSGKGTLNVAAATTLTADTLSIAADETLTLTGSEHISFGTITNHGTLDIGTGTKVATSNNIVVNAGETFTTTGAGTLASAAELTVQGGTATLGSKSEWSVISIGNGSLTINADTTVSGNLNVGTGNGERSGDITVAEDATLTVNKLNTPWGFGSMTINGVFNATEQFSLNTGAHEYQITGTGTINTKELIIQNQTSKAIFSGGLKINIGDNGIKGSQPLELRDVTVGVLDSSNGWSASRAITLGSADTGTTFNIGNGKAVTLSGAISGSGKLVKDGDGTLNLAYIINNNGYTGNIEVKDGTLTVKGTNGDAFHNVNVAEGATVEIIGTGSQDYRFRYTLDGGTLTSSGNATGSGNVQNDQITLTKSSTISGSANFYILGGSYGVTSLDLQTHTLTKEGTNTVSLINTDVSTGTIVVNEGTVEFYKDKTHSRVQANIELNGGTISGAYTYKASDSPVTRNLTAKQDVTVDAAIEIGNNVTLATSVDNGMTLTMTGAITGTGNFSLSGTGTLALGSSINTTGDVTVAAGSAITFANGATITANTFGLGTGSKLDFSDYKGAIGSEIHVVTTTTGVTGYAGAVITAPTAPRGMQASVEEKDNDIVLTFQAKEDATMHLYILTGQSNSMGTSKDVPLPQGMLDAYSTEGGMLWNGNMYKATQASPGGSRYVENPTWQGVLPQLPEIERNGKSSLCMGPEYGFTYMMLQKGWFSENAENDSLGVMKASLDGGGNSFWVKDGSISNYGLIVDSMQRAIEQAADMGYSTLSVDGLMYLQGESDGGDSSLAETRFAAFLENLTNDLDAWKQERGINVALVFSDNAVTGENFSNNTTSQIFLDAATSDDKINADMNGRGHVLTKDLAGIGDGLHFTGNSQLTIGARYAYAFAVQKDINVGAVRGQDDSKTLDQTGAWWMEKLPDENEVATWDISSVSTVNNIAADATLTVGGIKIDEVYHEGATAQGQGSIAINGGAISLGAGGINLVGGDLSITSAVSARATQTWQAEGDHKLAVNGTTTIDTDATLKLADDLYLTFGYITGTGSLEIGTVTFDMDLDYMGTMAKASYISSKGEGPNGYVNEVNLIDLTAGDGTISFTHGGSVENITKRGGLADCTLTLGEDSKTLKVTMPSTAEKTVYFTRSGEVTYTADDADENGIYNATELVLSGQQDSPATLTLSTALKSGVGIKAEGLGGTVKIGSNVVLNASSLETDGAPVTIAGSGEYVGKTLGAVGSVTAADVLGAGVTLASDWTGSVVLSGGNSSFSGHTNMGNLADFYKTGSTIVFNGMYGYFDNNHTIGANIEFRGTGGDGTGAALTYTAGNNKTVELSGTVTGKGDFVFDKNGGNPDAIKFTGDIAGWNGTITTGNHSTATLNLTFGGAVTVVNAAITKGQNHPINVTVDATNAVSFNKALTNLNSLTLNASKSASVLGGISTTDTTLKAGSSLTIGGTGTTNSLGTVTVNGSGSSLTINQAATITGMTLSNNAGTTVTNNVAGTNLGNVALNNNTALTIAGTAAVAAGNVKVNDQCAATITLANDFSMDQLDTIGANKTLSIASEQGMTKTLTTGALGFDNVGTVISLQNVNMVVSGAATVGVLDHHNNNTGTMKVGTGASLTLQGTTQWNTGDTENVNLVIENGGAVSVTGGTENKLRGVNLGAGSSLTFGAESTTTIGGAVVLANTITNDGSVTLTGTVNLDALTAQVSTEIYGSAEVATAGNGFLTAHKEVRVFNEGHVGSLTMADGVAVSYNGLTGTIHTDDGVFYSNDTPTLSTFYVRIADSAEDYSTAHVAATTSLTTVSLANATTINMNEANATLGTLTLAVGDAGAATMKATANATVSAITGLAAGQTLNFSGETDTPAVLTLNNDNTGRMAGNVDITGVTVKLGNYKSLGAYNGRGAADGTSRTITVGEGGVLDMNGAETGGDHGYEITLDGGTLTNTGTARKWSNRQPFTNVVLASDSKAVATADFGLMASSWNATTLDLQDHVLEVSGAGRFYLSNTTVNAGENGLGTILAKGGTVNFNGNRSDAGQQGSFAGNLQMAADASGTAGTIAGRLKLGGTTKVSSTVEGNAPAVVTADIDTNGQTLRFEGTQDINVAPGTASGGDYNGRAEIKGNGTIAHASTGTTTFSGSMANFTGSVDVQAGELNIMNIAQASSLNVKDVTIAAGATMGVYNGDTATPETASEGTLTMKAGNTLKAGGDNATLNANLVMEAGSVLEVSLAQATHGLTMGSTVALNTGDLLGDADLGFVQNLKFGEYYYLYNDVESLSVNGTQYGSLNFKDWTDFDMDASVVYNTQLDEKRYALVYSWNGSNVGTIAITLIPEPTTSTLSLLALAALAARRRKH